MEKLIASNFAELEGLRITGTIPVKQELMNEVLAEALKGALAPPAVAGDSVAAGTAATDSAAAGPRLEPSDLLKLITRAEITAHEGEIRLQFEIRR
ncbi:MAG: hypothetical protein H7Z41_12915 [Cytophagales bacterium]|nr:hypothetical protein [Armatimonadota bacterium]